MSGEPTMAESPATDALLDATNDPPSTDTDAVQNLIIALRASLTSTQTLLTTQTTRLTHLGDVETELAKVKDEHAFVCAAKEAVEVQLKEETKKREVAEETVEALRGQVEAARRGVMTLQKQEKDRKRMSTLGALGLGGVGEEEEVLSDLAAAGGAKDRSKRQSMLKSHRRISSQSEPDAIYASPAPVTSPAPVATPSMPQAPQPARPGLREFRLGTGAGVTAPTATSPRPSSSQHDEFPVSPKVDPSIMSSAPSNSEDAARLRSEVTSLQVQLAQAEEAREASENCLRALREFIAASPGGGGADSFENQMDLTSADLVGIRLPPLPTDRDPDEPPTPPAKEERKSIAGGWGLGKLWKGQAAAAGSVASPRSTAVEPATPALLSPGTSVRSLPQRSSSPTSVNTPLPNQEPTEDKVNAVGSTSTPLSNFVANWTKNVAPGTPAAATPAASGTSADRPSAARGFSGFWGRKKEEDKSKELPETPEVIDKASVSAPTGLEPSPLIDEQPLDADARAVSPELGPTPLDFSHSRADTDDDAGAEAGLATPKQSDRGSKELEPMDLNKGDEKPVDVKVEAKE